MEEENCEKCPVRKPAAGHGVGKLRNMPRKETGGGAWKRKIAKYAPQGNRRRGMERENCEICPARKPAAGHGEKKLRKMPRKETDGGAWKREIAKYAPSGSKNRRK